MLLHCYNLQMPGVDGIQLAKAIQEYPHLHSTKLVLLTSLGQRSICNSLMRAGISGCLVKPVRREHLFLTLAKLSNALLNGVQGNRYGEGTASQSRRDLYVLVAEDNTVNQRILIRFLERLGHRYDLVENGAAAIEAVQRAEYDLVLMDCQMPVLDGFEAATIIRGLSGTAHGVPIVAVTANAMSGDRERCIQAGMTGYLTKPFGIAELAAAIENS